MTKYQESKHHFWVLLIYKKQTVDWFIGEHFSNHYLETSMEIKLIKLRISVVCGAFYRFPFAPSNEVYDCFDLY